MLQTLILLKIYNSIFISYKSLHNDKAHFEWIYNRIQSSFNVFDKDILDEDEKQSIINNEKEKEKANKYWFKWS